MGEKALLSRKAIIQALIMVLSIIPFSACSGQGGMIKVRQGMTLEEFSRVNPGIYRPDGNPPSAFGINSPHTITLTARKSGTVDFFSDSMSGGTVVSVDLFDSEQVKNGRDVPTDPSKYKLSSILIDVGQTYMPIGEALPLMRRICDDMADQAGVILETIGDININEKDHLKINYIVNQSDINMIETIRKEYNRIYELSKSEIVEMTLCQYSNKSESFSISLGHYAANGQWGKDFSRINLKANLSWH